MAVCGSAPREGLLHLHQGRIDRFSVTDGLSGDIITEYF